ncbi:MAG: hypothetical protein U1C52_01940 [Patescibacteria group bacterium]|nr:hypothetical protein [Patescibacteria group bacterium]
MTESLELDVENTEGKFAFWYAGYKFVYLVYRKGNRWEWELIASTGADKVSKETFGILASFAIKVVAERLTSTGGGKA